MGQSPLLESPVLRKTGRNHGLPHLLSLAHTGPLKYNKEGTVLTDVIVPTDPNFR